MEQITKKDGKYYYGKQICSDSNDAYCRFRDDYHASLGKRVHRRLNAAEREERIHGFHIYFSEEIQTGLDAEFKDCYKKIPYRLLGLVGISYCRGIDGSDLPDYDEDQFERWFDWFLSHGDELMTQVGRNEKSGRTNKNKQKYR